MITNLTEQKIQETKTQMYTNSGLEKRRKGKQNKMSTKSNKAFTTVTTEVK